MDSLIKIEYARANFRWFLLKQNICTQVQYLNILSLCIKCDKFNVHYTKKVLFLILQPHFYADLSNLKNMLRDCNALVFKFKPNRYTGILKRFLF